MIKFIHNRLLILFVLSASAVITNRSLSESVDYFTDNGFANAISTLQHPTAEFFKGTTYIAY
ncbi:MAG: hypothetical protein WCO38_01985, partial [Verrucomicrobiota bacterium]